MTTTPEGALPVTLPAQQPARGRPPGPGDDFCARLWSELLADELPRYEGILDTALAPQRPYLTENEYALYGSGKRLRPAVLLLCARLAQESGPLPEKALRGAVSLEMLHIATLVHDDVVDGSALRRGLPSVNAVRGTETAVLVGDLQFVQAVRGFADAIEHGDDMRLVRLVLDAAFEICCGELDELTVDPSWDPAVLTDRYWRTAERKTAELFGLAAESGVLLAGGHRSDARRAGFYGRRIGRAFQVMDDLFDLVQDPADSGKPLGVDLLRRRASLPLIYAMAELGPGHRVSRVMRGEDLGDQDGPDGIRRVTAEIRASSGFARAYADARAQALDAIEHLRPFPAGRYRHALEDLALHVVDRVP
ncbi:polyprenyl synthetase [Streptomyces mashuensis]|uniref:Polyprenyl synthetase n=1 Tax=Streptomyces mashuensis TaxID=33904 RepID=A0A919B5K7_9ACTN|nr:polyprenyl synthetase family protein [Streptomyces mashuensis]GHF52925.1 polyprenyl synthetase [Streptomyces mashuensis]